MGIEIVPGDCRNSLKLMVDCSIDACVTDPPYVLSSIVKRFGAASASDDTKTSERIRGRTDAHARAAAGFMGKLWDSNETVHDPAFWAEVYRVLKPGAHLLAFGGTRTYHRMTCAIEDAGFEIRDCICWLYGTGFPKSHDVAKAIDKAERGVPQGTSGPMSPNHGKYKTGATEIDGHGQGFGAGPEQFMREPGTVVVRELVQEATPWTGWGTALKPAFEPIVVARKPIKGTVVENVLRYGTGGINIDGCRIDAPGRPAREIDPKPEANGVVYSGRAVAGSGFDGGSKAVGTTDIGRWPANVCHDGSDEMIGAFPDAPGQQRYVGPEHGERPSVNGIYGDFGARPPNEPRGDAGSAARFFYSAKAGFEDRWGTKHPTVKPVELMRWLCRLVTPPNGTVLDPFSGSGTTGVACIAEGFSAFLCEREEEYLADIRERIAYYQGEAGHSLASKGRKIEKETAAGGDLPLFKEGVVP